MPVGPEARRPRWLLPLLASLSALLLSACPPPVTTAVATAVGDKIAPTITVTSPQPGQTYNATVVVSGTITDSAITPGDNKGTLRSIDYTLANDVLRRGRLLLNADGTTTVDTSFGSGVITWTAATHTYSFTISTVSPSVLHGLITVTVDATDANGNVQSQIVQMSEGTGPVITITSPTGANLKYIPGTTVMSLAGTLANSSTDLTHDDNLTSVSWAVTGKTWGATIRIVAGTTSYTVPNNGLVPVTSFTFNTTTRTFATSFTVPFISDQSLILTVSATDLNGHTTVSTNYLVDNVSGPQLILTSPTANQYYSSTAWSAPVVAGNVDATVTAMTMQLTTAGGYTSSVITIIPAASQGTGDTTNYSYSSATGNFTFLLQGAGGTATLLGAHGTATVTIKAVNAASTTTTASYTVVEDSTPPTISNVAVTSSNANPAFAKDGDTVTLTFQVPTPVSGFKSPPTVTIAGAPATVTGPVGSTFTAQHVMLPGDPVDGSGHVPVTISVTDGANNTASAGNGTTNVTFYDGSFTLTPVTIASNDPGKPAWARANDTVSLSFTTPRALQAVPAVTISTHSVTASPTTLAAGTAYTASYKELIGDANGTVPFTVSVTDAAGNPGSASSTTNGSLVTLKTNPPGAPTSAPVSSTGPTWINAAERSAGFTMTVALAGTGAAAGDTLSLQLGGTTLLTYTLTATDITNGNYAFPIPLATSLGADGTKSFTALDTDQAGNIGAVSPALSIKLKTIAPTATATPTSSTGATWINAAQDTAGITITVGGISTTGAQVGDTLALLINGSAVATQALTAGQISGGFGFSVSSAMLGADGLKSFTTQITDQAGNPGTVSAALNLTLKTIPPSAPAAPTSSTGPSWINAAQRSAGFTITVSLSGVGAAAGDTLTLQLGGSTLLTQVLAAGDITAGQYAFTISSGTSLGPDGPKSFTAFDTDAAGNVGAASPALGITLKTTAPGAPSSAPVSSTGPTWINAAERTAGFTITVTLSGTSASAGDALTLLMGGSPLLTYTLTPTDITNGNYAFPLSSGTSLGADGAKSFTARDTDQAGNLGALSSALNITLKTVAPTVPTPVSSTGATWINAAERSAGFTMTVSLGSTGAAAGDTLTLLLGGSPLLTHVLLAADITAGSYAFTISSGTSLGADGPVSFAAQDTDAAGNVGATSAPLNLTLKTSVPTAPTAPVSSTGASYINAAERTAGFTITVGGLGGTGAQAGDTLILLMGGSTLLTYTLTGTDITNGSYVFTISSGTSLGADGAKSFTSGVTDQAGNVGALSAPLAITLDTTAPTAPSAPTSSTGATWINAAQDTAGITITVSGMSTTGAVPGDLLTLALNGSSIATQTLTAGQISGGFGFTVSSGMLGADGAKAFKAQITDQAGNVGAFSAVLNLTLDTVTPGAPGAPVSSTGATWINAAQRSAGFTMTVSLASTGAAAGDTLTLQLDASTLLTRVLAAADITAGQYAFTISSGTGLGSDGLKSFTGQITDPAGNPGSAGPALSITLKATVPTAPSTPTSSTGVSYINAAQVAASFTITVGGLGGTGAQSGDTLNLLLGASTLLSYTLTATDITNGSYGFLVTSSTSLGADGSKTFKAQVTDQAGNVGASSGALGLTLDTTPPGAPAAPTSSTGTLYINASQRTAGFTITVGGLAAAGAAAGDTLTLQLGGSTLLTQVLAAADITAGHYAFTISSVTSLGLDGPVSFTGQITDAAGNPGPAGSALNLTLDTVLPAILTVTYNSDTQITVTFNEGVARNSGMTQALNNGSLTVTDTTTPVDTTSVSVTHTAGASTATIATSWNTAPTSGDQIVVALATTIYDAEGNSNSSSSGTGTKAIAIFGLFGGGRQPALVRQVTSRVIATFKDLTGSSAPEAAPTESAIPAPAASAAAAPGDAAATPSQFYQPIPAADHAAAGPVPAISRTASSGGGTVGDCISAGGRGGTRAGGCHHDRTGHTARHGHQPRRGGPRGAAAVIARGPFITRSASPMVGVRAGHHGIRCAGGGWVACTEVRGGAQVGRKPNSGRRPNLAGLRGRRRAAQCASHSGIRICTARKPAESATSA